MHLFLMHELSLLLKKRKISSVTDVQPKVENVEIKKTESEISPVMIALEKSKKGWPSGFCRSHWNRFHR